MKRLRIRYLASTFVVATLFLCWSTGSTTAALVGYWPLNGNATAAVGLDGSPVNGPLAPTFDGTGVPGGALRFDGSLSQHVDVPGGGGLDGTTVGTISMWAKWIGPQSNYHTGLNAPGAILSRQSDGTFSDNVIALSGTDPAAAGLTWRQNGAGPPIIIGGTAVGDDFWRHVAVRYSPGESELFLDGVSQGTAIGLPLNSNPLIPLSIGAWAGHGSTYSNSAIDDVAVFDDYLSATQINDLFTRTETPLTVGPGGPGVPPPFFGLVGHWEFEGNTLDSSGLDNHGTLEGAATVSGSDVPPIFGGTGALSLGGGGDHVLVDHHASLDITSEMTIAAWVKTTGDPAWDGIVAKAPSNGSASNSAGNYELRVENVNRQLSFHHQQGGVDDTQAYNNTLGTGGAVVPSGTWVHVAVTAVAGGNLVSYINGVPTGPVPTVLGTFGATNTNPLYIGSRADLFTTMDGLIDDLRIYNTALSPAEIAEIITPPDLLPATIDSVTSELLDNFDRQAAYLVDGSGLVGLAHSNVPDGTMWLNHGTFREPHDEAPEITFDLGEVVVLDRMKVWNYNEDGGLTTRGIATADILVSNDGVQFDLWIPGQAFLKAPGTVDVDFGEVIDLQGVSARYVKFDILTSHGGDNNFVGLSEVQFFGVVPEPSSVVLALLGMIGLVLATRRRK